MPDFTMPLYRVMELTGDIGDGLKIGLHDYPIFDENERVPLNKKIIDHFWLREMGQETITQFTFMLGRTMREQMPLYNQLYLSSRIEFDPLATYKLSTVRNGTAAENSTATTGGHNASTTNSASRSVSSTTPQTMLSGSEEYATGAADSNATTGATSDSTGTNSMTGTTTQADTSTTSGFQGAASDLLTKFRNTILNIDMLVINELNDSFMQIWSTNREILPASTYNNMFYTTSTDGYYR